jgi:hypothetical protein
MPVTDQEQIKVDFGRETKYPWDEWLNGETHIITHGEDFDVSFQAMQAQLHTRAGKEGLKVRTKRLEGDKLAFQFSTPTEETLF